MWLQNHTAEHEGELKIKVDSAIYNSRFNPDK
jgi:hypothetical protein